MIRFFLAGAVLMTGAAAVADSPKAEKSKKSELVCRSMGETGSRLSSKRVCMTREQWAEHRRATRDAIDQAQTRQNNFRK